MLRIVLFIGAPLWLSLLAGGIAGLAAVAALDAVGLALTARQQALPVVACVVLVGFRGATEAARRLVVLLAERDGVIPSPRR